MHRWLLRLAAVVALLGAVTLVALEGREVIVVETTDAAGGVHRTRTWVADADDALWVEAATPDRPFLRDLAARPTAVVERGGTRRRCVATVDASAAGHRRIRALLADRYGWADCWIALVADTRASAAVRLACGDSA